MRKLFVITALIISYVQIIFSVTLKFYCLAWQPGAVDAVYDIVDEWNETHPDVQVEIVWGTWESSDQYLLTNFQSGSGPDIFHTDSDKFFEFGLMGFVEPLNSYITPDIKADIPERAWKECKDDKGNIYCIPWAQESQVIFYNKGLFDELGIKLEKRIVEWEELLDIARKIVDKTGGKTWGILAPFMEYFDWTLIAQNGGHVLVKDSKGRWKVDIDEKAREAIEFYISLVTKYKVMPKDVISIDYTSLMNGFLNGKYAMVVFGCWNRRFIVESAGDNFEWGLMWVQRHGNKTNASDPQGLGISKFSKHKKEAFEFIKFFTNAVNSAKVAYGDWLFPVRKSALKDPRFRSEEYDWQFAYELLKYAQDVKPQMPGFYTFNWNVYVPTLQNVMLGKMTLENAFKIIETKGNKLLKRMGLR